MGTDAQTSGRSVLYKHIEVGPLRASILTVTAFIILILTLILHIVAIAIPEWAFTHLYTLGTTKIGLWKECLGSTCINVPDDGTLRTVRAFAILAFLTMLAAVVVTLMYVSPITSNLLRYIMIGTRAVTALFLMITFSVFTQRGPAYGPAFALEIMCFIFEVIAMVLLIIDLFVLGL